MSQINQNKETTALLLSLLITIGAITGGLRWLDKKQGQNKSIVDLIKPEKLWQRKSLFNSESEPISQGESILITQNLTPEKQAAAKAIANQDYTQAVSQLEQSLAKQPDTQNKQNPLLKYPFAS